MVDPQELQLPQGQGVMPSPLISPWNLGPAQICSMVFSSSPRAAQEPGFQPELSAAQGDPGVSGGQFTSCVLGLASGSSLSTAWVSMAVQGAQVTNSDEIPNFRQLKQAGVNACLWM